ncbi:hypothetical protein S83_001409, partial [Arachis hypogaea]
ESLVLPTAGSTSKDLNDDGASPILHRFTSWHQFLPKIYDFVAVCAPVKDCNLVDSSGGKCGLKN